MTQARIETQKGSRPTPAVTGGIDAIIGRRILGWAWDPQHPNAHIAVRMTVGDKVVAEMIANQPREHLTAYRFGNGDHAFSADLPEGGIRSHEVHLFAVSPSTGGMIELVHQPTMVSSELTNPEEVRQALLALHGSLLTLHSNLRSTASSIEEVRRNSAASSNGAESIAAQLNRRLDTMDLAILRIDKMLQDLGMAQQAQAGRAGDLISRILAGAAAILAAASLLIALVH